MLAISDCRLDNDPGPIRVAAVLGNAADEPWRGRLAGARVDVLRLDQAEAQKSRLRKATEGGTDVAIILDRGVQVRDGDVLEDDSRRQRKCDRSKLAGVGRQRGI